MKVKDIGIAGTAALLLAACENSDYELQNLVPDEYHKVLYINNAGTEDLTLYNTGQANTFAISVFKGGSDPSLTADATLRVHTEAEVQELYGQHDGLDYRIIPDGSYTLDQTQLAFAAEERYKIVTLSLTTETIEAAVEANPEATYVLPLYLYSETDSVNADKSELFIRMTEVLTPALGFTSTAVAPVSYTYGFGSETLEVSFGLDTDNSWDIECQFAAEPSYVDSYNAKNKTSYLLLPDGSYTFDAAATLPSTSNSTNLAVTVDGSALTPGDYMLPIRLTGASMFSVSEANAVYPLVVRVIGTRFDRSGWSISANTQEPTGEGVGNGVATCLLDGDLSTFWHSQWSGGSQPLPHEITVDMKKVVTLTNIGLIQRQHDSYRDVGGGEFFVSSDGSTWTSVGTFSAQQVLEEQIFTVTPTQCRYFKVQITRSNRDANSSLAELYGYGVE